MWRKVWFLLLVTVLAASMVSQTASAALVARKISGVMPAFGNVSIDAPTAPQFSRNGTYMVYVADQRVEEMFELFRAPVYTNELRTLLSVGLAPGGKVTAFTMASNRQELIYLVNTGPNGGYQDILYRVAVSGPPSVQLFGPPIGGDVVDFKLSRDSGRVVFRAYAGTDEELYSTAMGGGPARKLSHGRVVNYAISPDSKYVVYAAHADSELTDLFIVPIDGGTSIKVGSNIANLHILAARFYISPDSKRLVFFGWRGYFGGAEEVYSAPISSGAATRLDTPLAPGAYVRTVAAISPDSNLVVYKADPEADGTFDLYTVPIDGGTSVKVSYSPFPERRVEDGFRFSPDSSHVLYHSDQLTYDHLELFSTPVGGGPAEILSGVLPPGKGVKQFEFTPDGHTVVFQAEHIWSYNDHLYSVPVDGGVTPIDLLATMGDAGDADSFAISPYGHFVGFLGHWGSDSPRSLYRVQIDGTALVRLSENIEDDRSVDGFWISPTGAVTAYGADAEVQGRTELYAAYDETKAYVPFVAR